MIITIARQCGCGAEEVGRLLAARYGVPLYTRRSLMQTACARGLSERMAYFFDERPADELLFSIASYGDGRAALTEGPLRTLSEMVGSESCVIIGRCGNHIFRHRPDLVSVFLSGAESGRIARIARAEGLAPAEAAERVRTLDEQRAVYHEYYTGLTWGNAADYDLCLDTLRLGAERTAQIIGLYADQVI